ncbi:MAG: hypothetical protein NC347_02895 [Clostridium sp.]|nr:hypothetical protein [Clostridium sp.]
MVKIKAKVKHIAQDAEKCYLRLDTDKQEVLICSYQNVEADTKKQSIIPNLKKNSEIVLFGYYTGIENYEIASDQDFFGGAYVSIAPVYACVDYDIKVNFSDMSYEYKNLRDNPYAFSGHEVKDKSFVVDKVIEIKEKSSYYLRVYEENKKDTIYFLKYELDEKEKSFIPIVGQVIIVSGTYSGQFKELKNESLQSWMLEEYQKQERDSLDAIENKLEKDSHIETIHIQELDCDLYPSITVEDLKMKG